MLSAGGVYAMKKRKKPVQKSPKPPPPEGAKSNPSKRHRDRLNQELNKLTSLLPFPEDVRARLDKLSILRLIVGYLKVKGYFTATVKNKNPDGTTDQPATVGGNGQSAPQVNKEIFSEGDLLLQALNGFIVAVTADGYIFYVSPTVQDYLGFHQSDIIYQSVFELIHTDDRAMFQCQLHWSLNPPSYGESEQEPGALPRNENLVNSSATTYDPQHLPPENSSFLERSFICRFRCLLDNSSGFLALNFSGRLKFLHGQNKRAEDGSLVPPQLALFAIATPLQPLSILELRTKTFIFQTKHKLDFTPTACDSRGKVVLGYTETELCMRGSGYQFIHAADMMYCAENHVRMIKTGESGMTVFRLLTKKTGWVWVQANARLVYKGGQPDCIIAKQRALSNEEGEEHLRKRALQLPFNFATGEAVLYENNLPGLLNSFPSKKASKARKDPISDQEAIDPNSLLGAMMQQDKSVYVSRAAPVPQFSFTDISVTPGDLWLSDKNGKTVKEESDSLLAIIETLFEKNEADGDICKTLHHLDVDDLDLQQWEDSLLKMDIDFPTPQDLQERLSQGVSSYMEEVMLFRNNGKNVDFPTVSGVTSSPPLQQIPLESCQHSAQSNQLPSQFPVSPKRKEPSYPQAHFQDYANSCLADPTLPGFQTPGHSLPQQSVGCDQQAPLLSGLQQNTLSNSQEQMLFDQPHFINGNLPSSSGSSVQRPTDANAGGSAPVFQPSFPTSLSQRKSVPENQELQGSGFMGPSHLGQFKACIQNGQWHESLISMNSGLCISQSCPEGNLPGGAWGSLAQNQQGVCLPMEMGSEHPTGSTQPNVFGTPASNPWLHLAEPSDYSQQQNGDLCHRQFFPVQLLQKEIRQSNTLEADQLPGNRAFCSQALSHEPLPVQDVYSREQQALLQKEPFPARQHQFMQTRMRSQMPCRTAVMHQNRLLHVGGLENGDPYGSFSDTASQQRNSTLQTSQRSASSCMLPSGSVFSPSDYESSIPPVEMDSGLPKASHPSLLSQGQKVAPCHSGNHTETSHLYKSRLLKPGLGPTVTPAVESILTAPSHPFEPNFTSVLLLDNQPAAQPLYSYNVQYK
ncbi:aryl hydrocarbon receptor-like [Tachyglossus aculeatus]|uniref:aryl hydrocarbon receptor-like n=1 Tax=Tachyglossus aculeatus TaxID=9261 RepID=UPI0018F31208|nr:aryl hydrocarbon receptor-like [Tachyglossus aculeatus]